MLVSSANGFVFVLCAQEGSANNVSERFWHVCSWLWSVVLRLKSVRSASVDYAIYADSSSQRAVAGLCVWVVLRPLCALALAPRCVVLHSNITQRGANTCSIAEYLHRASHHKHLCPERNGQRSVHSTDGASADNVSGEKAKAAWLQSFMIGAVLFRRQTSHLRRIADNGSDQAL